MTQLSPAAPVAKKSKIPIWRSNDYSTDGEQHVQLYEVDAQDHGIQVWRPEVLETIEAEIDASDKELRELNLDIHGTAHMGHHELELLR